MINLFIFLFVLGVLIIVHEFGHFIVAKKIGVRVERFALGFGTQLFCRKKGETDYCINAVPLGGYVKMAGDSLEEYKGKKYEYMSQPPGRRFWIIASGALLNYIMGAVLLSFIFFFGYPTVTTNVGGLLDGFGAQSAGIRVGDRIVAVDGEKVEYWDDLQKVIQSKSTAPSADVLVLRGNRSIRLKVKLRQKEVENILGEKQSIGILGIAPGQDIVIVKHGVFESAQLGIQKTWGMTVLTYKALGRMVTGKLSMRESVTGPLGIFLITSHAARLGVVALLHLMAVLSISLAIFNLLPLPILDGGHIVLLGIEKLRGKYLSLKAERIINQIGLTIILSLAALVTFNDISRAFGDKIIKFFTK